MSETQFWKTTPRKLNALLMVHKDVNTPESEKKNSKKKASGQKQYIDNVLSF
jgi:hypothetical protein